MLFSEKVECSNRKWKLCQARTVGLLIGSLLLLPGTLFLLIYGSKPNRTLGAVEGQREAIRLMRRSCVKSGPCRTLLERGLFHNQSGCPIPSNLDVVPTVPQLPADPL